jgi:probable DNA metabolism protein
MQLVRLASETDFEGWRNAARAFLAQNIAPEDIEWLVGEESGSLFDAPEFVPAPQQRPQFSVPRDFIALCKMAILHNDSARFGLLYRLLWRLKHEPKLLQVSFDPDVAQVQAMAKAVQRDLHKMKAFVRFREIESEEGAESNFVAWFEPSHHIVQASASFFTGRFTNMRWSILTPDICMHWDGETLSYSPGASKADAPAEDAGEDLWRAYYRSIFNPARLKVSAMQAQMPKKYWHNLPEAPLIADLVANANKRKDAMIAAQPTEPHRKIVKYVARKEGVMPAQNVTDAIAALRDLNAEMLATEFPLAAQATQAVLGSGTAPASIMLLGEQPGEQEDLAGQPFIGPAGKLLDKALQEAGIARSEIYVTNTLKHYKFKLQGTRRVHMVPGVGDIKTYTPWLQREVLIVQPKVILALGSIAARAITGQTLGLEDNRGKLIPLTDGRQAILAYHPSFILRTPDKGTKQLRYERLVADLALAAKAVAS